MIHACNVWRCQVVFEKKKKTPLPNLKKQSPNPEACINWKSNDMKISLSFFEEKFYSYKKNMNNFEL